MQSSHKFYEIECENQEVYIDVSKFHVNELSDFGTLLKEVKHNRMIKRMLNLKFLKFVKIDKVRPLKRSYFNNSN